MKTGSVMKVDQIVRKRIRQFNLRGLKKEDLLPLYNLLKMHNYSEKTVFGRLGADDIDDILVNYLPAYLEVHLKENYPLDRLIKIFILARYMKEDEIKDLLGEDHIKMLMDVGILDCDENGYFSNVAIFPCKWAFLATDHMFTTGFHPNSVYPLGMDSYLLARAMIKSGFQNTLDMCCGCGVHGILAAKQSRKVTGIDKNPRAVNFARFNALLNQLGNVEFRSGDLYEPVEDEDFDWIIANPPFVPSPDTTLYFRHGSESGEGISKNVIRGIPKHLRDYGYAQIVTSMVMRENEDYLEKIKGWLGDEHFHLFALGTRFGPVHRYILNHVTTDIRSPEYYGDLVTWVESYRKGKIISIGDGLLNFRKTHLKKPLCEFRNFRMPRPGQEIEIKPVLDYMDMYDDNEEFSKLMESEFEISGHLQFYWQGKKPSGEINYGVLFNPGFTYEGCMIGKDEKEILDIISDGTKSGKKIRSKFEDRLKNSRQDKEKIFRNAFLNVLREEVVKIAAFLS